MRLFRLRSLFVTGLTRARVCSNHKNNSAMSAFRFLAQFTPPRSADEVTPALVVNGALTVTLEQAKQLGSVLGKETPGNWSKIQQDITILKAQSGILLEFGRSLDLFVSLLWTSALTCEQRTQRASTARLRLSRPTSSCSRTRMAT